MRQQMKKSGVYLSLRDYEELRSDAEKWSKYSKSKSIKTVKCLHCNESFEVGKNTGRRADSKFCTDSHRVIFHSLQRTKVK